MDRDVEVNVQWLFFQKGLGMLTPQSMSKWVTPPKVVIQMAKTTFLLSWAMAPKEPNRQRNGRTLVRYKCTSLRSGASHLGCEAALYASEK